MQENKNKKNESSILRASKKRQRNLLMTRIFLFYEFFSLDFRILFGCHQDFVHHAKRVCVCVCVCVKRERERERERVWERWRKAEKMPNQFEISQWKEINLNRRRRRRWRLDVRERNLLTLFLFDVSLTWHTLKRLFSNRIELCCHIRFSVCMC